MQKQQKKQWIFPQKRSYPIAVTYNPNLIDNGQTIMNPFLGYPNCPLIGRYNKGQYKIAQTICHLQFECLYNKEQHAYQCGDKIINLPEQMVTNLRNIPEVIKHNKPPNQGKNSKVQDVHPMLLPVRDNLKFCFIITLGELGKDFLNYLNHMYTLGNQLFVDQKLRRTVFLLPIYAYLPNKSGFMQEQVDKGLNIENYRSQYLSLHLKYGAPAFSPNNMRLGIEGMKKVQSNPLPKKQKKKYKQKDDKNNQQKAEVKTNQNIQHQQKIQKQEQKIVQKKITQKKQPQNEDNDIINWQQIQKQIKQQKQGIKNKKQTNQKKGQNKGSFKHKGYVHFYTSMLMEEDYRVYYHWHIDEQIRRDIVYEVISSSRSLQEMIQKFVSVFSADDECVKELVNIFK